MKATFHHVSFGIPSSADIRARVIAAFNVHSPALNADRASTKTVIAGHARRKPIKGGNDGGPPAGMVMPDMSIGAVPFYG